MRVVPLGLILAFCWLSGGTVAAQEPTDPFKAINALVREGTYEAAFERALNTPEAAYQAACIGTWIPTESLRLLDTTEVGAEHPERLLIPGEVLLSLRKKQESLTCFRRYAALIRSANHYPVEPQEKPFQAKPEKEDSDEYDAWATGIVKPPLPPVKFLNPITSGPGSHRDNWLLRRFLALEATPDAAREFDRVWQLHVKQAGAGQFQNLSLQCALDYAFFLNQNGNPKAAAQLLLPVLLRIDFERWPLGPEQGVSRQEFIRLVYDFFKSHHWETKLSAAVAKPAGTGKPSAWLLSARLLRLQGKEEAAFQQELAYVEGLPINPISKSYRRGLVFERFHRLPEARREFEACLTLPDAPPQLADVEEGQIRTGYGWFNYGEGTSSPGFPRYAVAERLQRLYDSPGDPETVLSARLRLIEWDPNQLGNHQQAAKLADTFKAAHREEEFNSWARKYVTQGRYLPLRLILAFYRKPAENPGIYSGDEGCPN